MLIDSGLRRCELLQQGILNTDFHELDKRLNWVKVFVIILFINNVENHALRAWSEINGFAS